MLGRDSGTSGLIWPELKCCSGSYETVNYLQDNEGLFLLKRNVITVAGI
jgi:hypothetical protein